MTAAPNPYSQFPSQEPFAEQRTSVLAIFSLICALLCPVPLLGILAVILGVVALVRIGGSNGRKGGRGLAIAGIIIGAIVTIIWIAGYLMVVQGMNMFTQMAGGPIQGVLTNAESGNFAGAREFMTTKANTNITDADMQRFVGEYKTELGAFKSLPDGMKVIGGYIRNGQLMQGMQPNSRGGPNVEMPLPIVFEKGEAIVVLQGDPPQGGNTGGVPKFSLNNLIILAPSGKKYTLYDPAKLPAGNTTIPVVPPPVVVKPETKPGGN